MLQPPARAQAPRPRRRVWVSGYRDAPRTPNLALRLRNRDLRSPPLHLSLTIRALPLASHCNDHYKFFFISINQFIVWSQVDHRKNISYFCIYLFIHKAQQRSSRVGPCSGAWRLAALHDLLNDTLRNSAAASPLLDTRGTWGTRATVIVNETYFFFLVFLLVVIYIQ